MDALGQTRLQEGRLIGVTNLVNDNDEEIQMLAQDIAANYALDDQNLDPQKVKTEIAKKNNASDDIRNMVGALQNAKQPLTAERLFAWHAAIGQNKVKKFRTKESSVGSFTGISAERIPLEMERFIDWIENSTTDGAIKAAVAHFWFLTIRPFEDGNGRIARALTTMILARSENTSHCLFALCPQILEEREEYLRQLLKAQSGNGDLTEWILWFLQIMRRSIEARERDIADTLKKIQFDQKNKDVALSERERKIVNAAWEGTLPATFSVKEAAALTGTSHDSALRDIQALIQKGIVRAESKGGRSQKYSLA
jgi:Fic family protein